VLFRSIRSAMTEPFITNCEPTGHPEVTKTMREF
jgi:hypothetical protein